MRHDSRIAFWVCSRPETATPPAFEALAGPNSTFEFWNTCIPSMVVGMLAPSVTAMTPLLTSVSASFLSSSFCVAQGNAI